LLCITPIKSKSPLDARLNPQLQQLHLNTFLKMIDLVTFNFFSTLYTAIRGKFSDLLQKAFAVLAEGTQEDIWENLEHLLFMSVVINGGCFFNGKFVEKTKEEMVLGIYL
jgi:hydrogenase maturation factor HypF (carbamoyltransferase family)